MKNSETRKSIANTAIKAESVVTSSLSTEERQVFAEELFRKALSYAKTPPADLSSEKHLRELYRAPCYTDARSIKQAYAHLREARRIAPDFTRAAKLQKRLRNVTQKGFYGSLFPIFIGALLVGGALFAGYQGTAVLLGVITLFYLFSSYQPLYQFHARLLESAENHVGRFSALLIALVGIASLLLVAMSDILLPFTRGGFCFTLAATSAFCFSVLLGDREKRTLSNKLFGHLAFWTLLCFAFSASPLIASHQYPQRFQNGLIQAYIPLAAELQDRLGETRATVIVTDERPASVDVAGAPVSADDATSADRADASVASEDAPAQALLAQSRSADLVPQEVPPLETAPKTPVVKAKPAAAKPAAPTVKPATPASKPAPVTKPPATAKPAATATAKTSPTTQEPVPVPPAPVAQTPVAGGTKIISVRTQPQGAATPQATVPQQSVPAPPTSPKPQPSQGAPQPPQNTVIQLPPQGQTAEKAAQYPKISSEALEKYSEHILEGLRLYRRVYGQLKNTRLSEKELTGLLQGACSEFQKAQAVDPYNPEGFFREAMAYALWAEFVPDASGKKVRYQQALAKAQKAVSLDANYASAAQLAADLNKIVGSL